MDYAEMRQINQMISICLDIANIINGSRNVGDVISAHLGIGSSTIGIRLRNGIQALVGLQGECMETQRRLELAESDADDARRFLQDVFGETDIDEYCDDVKIQIREFCKKLIESEGK